MVPSKNPITEYRFFFSPQILLPLKSKSSLGLSLLARQQIIAILWIVLACLFIGSGLDFPIGYTCERFAQAAKSLPGNQFLTTLLNNDLWDALLELWIFSMLTHQMFPWNGAFGLIMRILLAGNDLDAHFLYAEIANLGREMRTPSENTRGQIKDRRQALVG